MPVRRRDQSDCLISWTSVKTQRLPAREGSALLHEAKNEYCRARNLARLHASSHTATAGSRPPAALATDNPPGQRLAAVPM
jgi:hypothetical protein